MRVKPPRLEDASFISYLTFSWLSDLIALAGTRPLEAEDLGELPGSDAIEHVAAVFSAQWKRERASGRPPRVWRALAAVGGTPALVTAMWTLVESGVRVGSAVTMRQLLVFVNDGGNVRDGLLLALALFTLGAALAITHHRLFWLGLRTGMRLRVASQWAVANKLLSLSAQETARVTTGGLVNLMHADVRRLDEAIVFGQFVWAGPLETLVVGYLIARVLSAEAAVIGIAALLALIPLQSALGHLISSTRRKVVDATDSRVRLTGEVLSGISGCKMFAWERAFSREIAARRATEEGWIRVGAMARAFNVGLFFSAPTLVAYVAFSSHLAFTGRAVSMPDAFYTLALLQLPRLWMCLFFPMGVEKISEALVTLERLNRVLDLGEENPDTPAPVSHDEPGRAGLLNIVDTTFHWEAEEGAGFELHVGELSVASGECVSLVGRVGTGKSSLLSGILGECARRHRA